YREVLYGFRTNLRESKKSVGQTLSNAHQRNELDDGGGVSQARRSRGVAARLHRTTRLFELERGQHFGRTPRSRGGATAGRPGFPGGGLWDHTVLSRISRNDHVARGNVHVDLARHSQRDGG